MSVLNNLIKIQLTEIFNIKIILVNKFTGIFTP